MIANLIATLQKCTIYSNEESMLNEIVKSLNNYVKCKAISLYIYNSETEKLCGLYPNREEFPLRYLFLYI